MSETAEPLAARELCAKYVALAEPALVRGFELLVSTPNGVSRLRSLLVTLAVRGLLVRQLASEEPAIELVRRVAMAGGRALPKLTIDGLPFGWVRIAFGDYASELNTGPFGSLIGKDYYVDGGVPLVNPSHMRYGRINAEARVSVSHDKAAELASYRLQAGWPAHRLGQSGLLTLWTERVARPAHRHSWPS